MRKYRILTPEFWQSWQTAGIALILVAVLFPYPSRFVSYVMGFCLGFAVVHWLLLPKKEKLNAAFRYALPYLSLYGILLVSCLFAENRALSFAYSGWYFSLLLIPLVFAGMSPSFFDARRIRIFAFALVAGATVGALWKFFVVFQTYYTNNILIVYREQGFGVGFRHFYEFYRSFVEGGYKLFHPAFEALFELSALVLVLQSWIRRDSFFSHGYSKVLSVFVTGIIMVNLLFFCTKTATLGCVVSVFALWVYALCKKRYVFAGLSSVGVLILAGGLTLYAPGEVLTRFNVTAETAKAFLKGREAASDSDASFLPRVYAYKTAWEMFKERPIVGWGAAYTKEFRHRYDESHPEQGKLRTKQGKNVIKHPHNQLLAILDAFGLVGGAVYLWILVCVLRDVWRRKSLFWWIWFAGLLLICTIDLAFSNIIGFIYLCGFHGVLFCINRLNLPAPNLKERCRNAA